MAKKFARPTDKYRPKTENHQHYWDTLNNNQIRYVACTGPSGVGKTLLAAKFVSQELLKGKYDKLYICTPIVELDNMSMGWLPGSAEEKLSPHMQRITQHLEKFLLKDYDFQVEFLPLAYIRGISAESAIVWVDEAQNMYLPELKALFTRICQNSRLLVTADFDQSDLKFYDKSDLQKVCEVMEDYKHFEWVKLNEEDIVRSKHISEILKRFKDLA